MRYRLIISLLLLMVFVSGCNDKEKNREKYNDSIKQVIELENAKLEELNEENIKRKEIGIIVYSNGNLIELMYHEGNTEINSIYEKSNDTYSLLPYDIETKRKIDQAGEANYIENLGKK